MCANPVSLNTGGNKQHAGHTLLQKPPVRYLCLVPEASALGLCLFPGPHPSLTQPQTPLHGHLGNPKCKDPPQTSWSRQKGGLDINPFFMQLLCNTKEPQSFNCRTKGSALTIQYPSWLWMGLLHGVFNSFYVEFQPMGLCINDL